MSTGERDRIVLSDGSTIEFEWCVPGGAALNWWVNDEHHPRGRTPMQRWIDEVGEAGRRRAWDEVGVPPLPAFRDIQHVGPFHYVRDIVPDPEVMACVDATGRVVAQHGGFVAFWERHCAPRAQEAVRQLASMDDASLQDVADTFAYGVHQTFTSVLAAFLPIFPLRMVLDGAGLDGQSLSQQLALGGDNRSQAIDDEIAALASLAGAEPSVVDILGAMPVATALEVLRSTAGASGFVAALDAVVAKHAARCEGWDLHAPTWGERPELVLRLVAARLRGDVSAPSARAVRRDAARADALTAARAALPDDRHGELDRLVAATEGYVGVREDRAYWQMVLGGTLRLLLLRRGRALAAAGRIDHADDVLFLTGNEPDDASADLRRLVTERRADWERYAGVMPPRFIGTAPAGSTASRGALTGQAASRGVVTAPARVIRSPDDVDRLGPGEILVCYATTPAWTPLFGIAGGVVTVTGSVTSHPAITAREYGIPAVVGVADALEHIADGALITVDGTAGVVRLADPP